MTKLQQNVVQGLVVANVIVNRVRRSWGYVRVWRGRALASLKKNRDRHVNFNDL